MPCQLFAYCVVSGNTNVEKSFQEIYNDDSMFIVIINVYIPNRRLDSLRNTLRLAKYCSSMMLLCISKKFKENNSVTTCISSAYNIMLILEQGYYHFFQYRFIHFYSWLVLILCETRHITEGKCDFRNNNLVRHVQHDAHH